MTIHTTFECNGCGEKVQPGPPRPILGQMKAPTTEWARTMVLGPDGVTFVDSEADLCPRCREAVMEFLRKHRAEADKRKLQ